MEITIKSRKLKQEFVFFKPTGNDSYVYDATYKPGTLGKQLCQNGEYNGATLTANNDNFETVCRRWLRARVAKIDIVG